MNLACRKAKELGYPRQELWTTRLLARVMCANMHQLGAHLPAPPRSKALCATSSIEQEIKPRKVRYYLERRDPQFKQKMAEVLCVYREVKLIEGRLPPQNKSQSEAVAIVSY